MTEFPEGDYIRAGGSVDEVSVSLRISGEDLEPDEITRMLGMAPTDAHRKGDSSDAGRTVRRSGLWSFSIGDSPEWELPDAIAALLDRLPDDPALWRSLSARFDVDLFCGLFLRRWNRGVSLPAGLVQRIARFGLELNLDIYYTEDVDTCTG